MAGGLTQTASDQIYGIMVGKVHGRPPEPHGVEDIDGKQSREEVSHEESLEGRPARVQRWESAEYHRRSIEGGSVKVNTKELVNCLQSCGIADNRVVCWCQSICVLVPGR